MRKRDDPPSPALLPRSLDLCRTSALVDPRSCVGGNKWQQAGACATTKAGTSACSNSSETFCDTGPALDVHGGDIRVRATNPTPPQRTGIGPQQSTIAYGSSKQSPVNRLATFPISTSNTKPSAGGLPRTTVCSM